MKKNNINQNKIFYNENQWSPLNPEGRKQYDRDFLLQLQSLPLCLCKPSNLPNLDIIKNKAHIQRLADVNRTAPVPMPPVRPFDPFMPQYARKENPLRPKLLKKIRYILNKLTPHNYQPLVEQVKKLPINTMKELEETIDIIFEKAVDEPRFCAHYAYMCKQLESIKVPLDDGQGVVSFRELLLEKCQKEFEQDENREKKPEDQLKAMKVERVKELQVEEQKEKMKMKRIGTITFLGELFKLNIIVEPIIHHCITKLLAEGEEESLECFCCLLKSVGKELDEMGNKFGESSLMNLYFVAMQNIVEENNFGEKTLVDLYFVAIQKIIDKRLISSRVRRMLQGVIDLKKNNWIPMEDESNLKIIDQIQKEAEKDTCESPQACQNIFSNSPPDDKQQLCGRSVGVSEVYCTPTSKSMKGRYSVVDPSKLKLTRPNEVHTIRLGPGGRGPSRMGYLGDNRVSVYSDMKTALINRSTATSRKLSPAHNIQLPVTVTKTPYTSRNRENLIKIIKALNINLESGPKDLDAKKVENQVNDEMATSTSAITLHGPEDLSEEDIEKNTKPLIDEFLYTGDFQEAEICFMELASPNTVHNFIHYAINYVLDKSSQTRYLLGKLLCSLVKKNVVTLEDYKKGLSGILENIDDYAVDIPKIWEYMGDVLEPMIEDKLPLSFLKDVLEPYIPSERAGKLISAVLHCAAKKKGTLKLGKLCKESGLQWLDILGTSENVNDFITDNELEFTVSHSKVEIITKLRELLENNEDNQSIFDYIDANASPSVIGEPTFIRALVQEVHKVAITGTDSKCELDKATLMKRMPLLTRYIHHNKKLELQTLYAVQHVTADLNQPKGLLRKIFDILYDDDVITEETFKVWESSDDPAELEGKGAALNCVRGFLTWLREVEESGEEAEDKRQFTVIQRKAKPYKITSIKVLRAKLREQLEFTASQRKVMPNTKISVEEIRIKLRELLENNEANNSIFDYIDANVWPSVVRKPIFIRALVQEVHKVAINGTDSKCELDKATLMKRMPLLTRYIHHNKKLELQTLYAVQHLTTNLNQPKGLLRKIFHILHDDNVITEETFKVWESSDDPAELEGKGAALNCVRGFFTWLREAEESGEEAEDKRQFTVIQRKAKPYKITSIKELRAKLREKLEFTAAQRKDMPNTKISVEEIRTKLRELLDNNEANNSIFDYIDANVSSSMVSEPAFIRTLVQEVHKVAITGTGSKCEVDQATLKKRIPLLTRYIDHKENLELQALYAVQHLTTDLNQPKRVLRVIFDILYEDDVITEETFEVWENSDDPAELEGKGAALNCVRGFFTWLRDAEESGEEVEDE